MLEEFKDQTDSTPEDFLKSILDSAFNGIMAFKAIRDSQHQIQDFEWLFINDIAEEIVGMKAETLLGARLLEVMPGNQEAGLFDKYVRVVDTGQSETFEQYYPGEKVNKWFKISAVRLDDGFTVTFQDITDLKEALLGSQVNEKKYQQLFEESIDAVFQIDQEFRFMEVSPSLERITGYQKDDLRQMSLDQLFDDPEFFKSFAEDLKAHHQVEEFETSLRDRSGSKKASIINCTLQASADQVKSYIGVIRDITKRKQTEIQLIRAEKLTMTGKLARTIAHEVRNPLTNLTLALEQLKDEVPADVEDAELYFNIIQRNANRIGNLINDLLNSSKPKELELEEVSPAEVIREAVTLVEDRLKLQKMKIELDINTPVPEILIDTNQLKIALLNLFINAIEAMKPDQGILKVETRLQNQWILINVIDNGKGLSSEQMKNLFEPFFTGKKEGTGLGLLTVQNIIHSHKGKIDVKSEQGSGTTFSIYLPVR